MIKRSKQEWQALFSEHKSSGLTAAAFCRERSLCPKYFALRKRQLANKNDVSFVQVKPAAQTGVDALTVSIKVTELSVPLGHVNDTLTRLLK